MEKRLFILVEGTVQGVGFRPYIYHLATTRGLIGNVKNIGGTVAIEVQGDTKNVDIFLSDITKYAPKASYITNISYTNKDLKSGECFFIFESENSEAYFTPSVDIAMCEKCKKELFNPRDKRYRYPFINCTECGPRWTIIYKAPYDRENTTMADFPMCKNCKSEYLNENDRRYHAEPIACKECGPTIFCDENEGEKALKRAVHHLKDGKIVAVKGIGGYHLACLPNTDIVKNLRERKNRDNKPFAVMMRDIAIVKTYCEVSEKEEELLLSEKAPIVILEGKSGNRLSEVLSGDTTTIGVLLPYTPLHALLLEHFDCLIMTSGNAGGQAIIFDDKTARDILSDIADSVLWHNRPICAPIDDSVSRVFDGHEYIIRHSRGYAPSPIIYNGLSKSSVFAAGAEMKSAFAVSKNDKIFLSQHIGELHDVIEYYILEIERYLSVLNIKPDFAVVDAHPNYSYHEYLSSIGIETIKVQHHRAHIAACFVENGLKIDESVIGVALDGLGYGDDGALWGGEIFTGNIYNLKRTVHLEYFDLPRGESALKPYVSAVSLGADNFNFAGVDPYLAELAKNVIKNKVNTVKTSSAGRLFDGAAAVLNLKTVATYDGEAGLALESLAYTSKKKKIKEYEVYLSQKGDTFFMSHSSIFSGMIDDLKNGVETAEIALKFHYSLAQLIFLGVLKAREVSGCSTVLLSGGVFQNILFLDIMYKKLKDGGFSVYTHQGKVPSNDGGIAVGQLLIGSLSDKCV